MRGLLVATLVLAGCGTSSSARPTDAGSADAGHVDTVFAPRVGGVLPAGLSGFFHRFPPNTFGLAQNIRFNDDGGYRRTQLECDSVGIGDGAWAELDGGVELLLEFPEAAYPTDGGMRIVAIAGVEPPSDWTSGAVCPIGECDGGAFAPCSTPSGF